MTTIGGVVFRHLDRLPHEGDSVVVEGYTATFLDMQGHRVAQVRIAKSGEPSESADGGEA
jgi:CBS domain containing-hemolysin-like protein